MIETFAPKRRPALPLQQKLSIQPLRLSLAFRLALLYGLAVIAAMLVASAMFYDGTVGVLGRGIDRQLSSLSSRLSALAAGNGQAALAAEIDRLLTDGIASDTEVYLLADGDGRKHVGNVEGWHWTDGEFGHLADHAVVRLGRPSIARILPIKLADGSVLLVGRDLPDQQEIRHLVARALGTGGVMALVMAIFGAMLFHRRIDQRLVTIRSTTAHIESGQLDWRIPLSSADDDFSRLDVDINHMLDRIQQLMEGVRQVSNAIAHDLRTPLTRLRGGLDEALTSGDSAALARSAERTIVGIDQLIHLFERLLQITETESGTRRQSFEPVPVAPLLHKIGELYDAMAEEKSLLIGVDAPVDTPSMQAVVLGDRALLSSMLANLVENAIKHAVPLASWVRLSLAMQPDQVEIIVEDNGPGIPPAERDKVLQRFYRLDRSRSLSGNGLGLSLVAAVVALHDGQLTLEDAAPGLRVRIVLPRPSRLDPFQTVS